jgi:hypothetical protein
MAKKDFLARQAAVNHGYFEAGLQMGRQQILDMMSIVLNDPKYVKKDVFGKDRLLVVVKGIGECSICFRRRGNVMMKPTITVTSWTHYLPVSTVMGCTTHSAKDTNIAVIMIM